LLRAAAALFAAAALATAGPARAQSAPEIASRDPLAEAEQAIVAGRPLAATRLLAPLLAKPGAKEPAVVLLAARAAAGWEGWGTVVQLLVSQTWLDDLAGGEGRALLARARVERGLAPLDDARRAVRAARGDALGPRLLTLARAFDRANLLDSAAATYLMSAAAFPTIADWLRLRAAGVLADSALRTSLYSAVTLPAAVPRVRWTEALARDRAGDWRGAAELYDGLGAVLAGVRLRLRGAREPTERAAVRRELVGLLTSRLSAADTRDAIALLDEAFPSLTPEEHLLVARRAAALDPARAVRAFARAVSRAKPLSETDQLSYAASLQRLGRHHDAMQMFGAIRSRELRAQAQYLRARSLLAAGSRSQALDLLEEVSHTPSGDSTTAATAGYLGADLLVDDGEENLARQAYLDVARRFPRTSHGPRAAFQAALLAWVHGDHAAAAMEFAALAERAAVSSEGVAALYWSGRALFVRGDTAAARARWQTLLERFPASYYSVPAALRLGTPAVREPAPEERPRPDSSLTAALDRAKLLEHLGLRVEARFEYDRLSRQAESSAEESTLLGTARAFFDRGLVARAYRLALRSPNAQGQRLAFPLPQPEVIEESRRAAVDPLLAAALIRQESAFDPFARSRADARGLMQVLPSVGAGLAPAAGISEWDPALLYQTEINVHFGIAHLAQTLARYPLLPVALAVYNAGERPTSRWLALPGAADDPEVFIERIQYVETRDYARRVLRNLAVYRAFYPELP
jgi:soluble lytic murein transglycosylase